MRIKKLLFPLFSLTFCFVMLLGLPGAGFCLVGLEDETEGDTGLSIESLPEEKKNQIPVLTIHALAGEPIIDGVVDDQFWQQAERFSLDYELYPERLAPAVVKTEALVGATGSHLYVAFIAFDPHPEQIRSALRERDASKEDDYVSIIIDPSGTLAKKYEFRVNPDGTLSDLLQDSISDRYVYDWDAEWQAAARRTENGYTVEIAIPANTIHVPPGTASGDTLGFVMLKRSYPRSIDRVLATAFSFKRQQPTDNNAPYSLSDVQRHESGSQDEKSSLPAKLSLTPHYIFHYDREKSIGGSFSQSEDQRENSLGLDATYAYSTATSLALTVNPDYTDVEADIARQSINNPFTIFQPEKRTFFQSASEYYNSMIPVIYTRNIIDPSVGGSFVHDSGLTSLAGFIVHDRATNVIVPDNLGSDTVELIEDSYSSALRYRQTFDKTTAGLSATYRGNDDGTYHNASVGVDGMTDFGPDDKLRYQFSYSDTRYPESFAEDLCSEAGCTDNIDSDETCLLGDCSLNSEVLRAPADTQLQGHNLQVRYKHDGPEGLYWVGYEQISPDYRADLGYVNRVDYRSFNAAYGKKWYFNALADDEGKSRFRTYVLARHSRSYEYDDNLEKSVSFWAEFNGTFQSILRIGYWFRDRAVNRIDQASLETGDNTPLFNEKYLQWYFETAPFNDWKLNFDGRVGKIADAANMVLGDMVELQPKITFRIGSLELTGSGTFREFNYEDEQLYREQFLSFTALYRSNQKMSHRFLYLDDLTHRNLDIWLGDDEPAKEYDRTLEYTITYQPNRLWKILAGVKLGYEYDSDVNDGDNTERQIYCKFERQI